MQYIIILEIRVCVRVRVHLQRVGWSGDVLLYPHRFQKKEKVSSISKTHVYHKFLLT
jgi:hypothetical protein